MASVSPAPIPWMNLKTISISTDTDRTAIIEAAMNRIGAMASMRLVP
jgi:hypothetical protein